MNFPRVKYSQLEAKLKETNLDSDNYIQKALREIPELYKLFKRRNGPPTPEGHLYPAAMYAIEYLQAAQGKSNEPLRYVVNSGLLVAGALLHDVMDGLLAKEYFLKMFGKELFRIVEPLTKPYMFPRGDTAEKRRQEFRERDSEHFVKLESAPAESKIIRLAGRLHNMHCVDYPKLLERYMQDAEVLYLPFAQKYSPVFYEKINQRTAQLVKLQDSKFRKFLYFSIMHPSI